MLTPGIVGGLFVSYLRRGGLDGTTPSKGGMTEACEASDMESRTSEALRLGLWADGDAVWAPLVLAMAEMERLVFHKVRGGARSGILQTHNLWASNSRIWGALQLIGLFRNLKGVSEIKMEKIRGLNMNSNIGWPFCKLACIRKLVRKLPLFAT